MIRRVKHFFKKNTEDAERAALSDAVLRRPKDNPYRAGSPEHALYEHFFDKAQRALEPEDLERGFTKLHWKTRTVRARDKKRFKRKRN